MANKNTFPFKIKILSLFTLVILYDLKAQNILSNHFLKTSPKVPEAQVFLNGKLWATTGEDGSCILKDVPVGKYIISVKKEGFYESSMILDLGALSEDITIQMSKIYADKEEKRYEMDFKEEINARENRNVGFLEIYCNINKAEIWIDGKYHSIIEDGYKLIELAQGIHLLEMKRKGYNSQKKYINIIGAKRVVENFTLNEISRSHLLAGNMLKIIIIISLVIISLSLSIYISAQNKRHIRFDRYIILNQIGRGGMATIFRAKDTSTKKLVALKIMDISFQNDHDMIKKFIKEGWAISEINKLFPDAPVVKVFSYGKENNKTKGRPYIAMELLGGKSLLSFIKNKIVLDKNFTFKVIEQVALALSAAHKLGIYHRDVTPDNVIVLKYDHKNPRVKLIDFGVARHEYTAIGTLDGSISGKPPYMSPEQCRGEKVDARSDIYSLGILFYTLLEGHPPFVSKNPFEVMKMHEDALIPPIKANISEEMKGIIYKMLAKNRNDRYKNIDEFLLHFKIAVRKEEQNEGLS